MRRAPNVAYDNPGTTTDGLRTADQFDMFNGATDRYDWHLVGKREIYVPYNAYQLHSNELSFDQILTPLHVNPEHLRYELHRVWVVEATLKEGARHIYKRRTLYLDEDSWQIMLADVYDNRDELWRVSEAHVINYYEKPLIWSTLEVHTDLPGRALSCARPRQRVPDVHAGRGSKVARFHPGGLTPRRPALTLADRHRRAAPPIRSSIALCVLTIAAMLLASPAAAQRAAVESRLAATSLLLDGTVAGSRMMVVGQRGHILISDDDGVTWRQAQAPVQVMLTAVRMLDAQTGWSVGHDATILRTRDGGETWQLVHYAPQAQLPLLDVWFRDADNGFAVGAFGAFLASARRRRYLDLPQRLLGRGRQGRRTALAARARQRLRRRFSPQRHRASRRRTTLSRG